MGKRLCQIEKLNIFTTLWTYMSSVNWYNFPSIVCLYTIIWNVKSHTVTINCYFRSYVIFLLILPLRHLKCKSITLKSVMQGKNLILLTVRHISKSLVITK